MYGYELPKTEFTIEIFGKETKITAQTYHAYESTFLEDYKKNYNEYQVHVHQNVYLKYFLAIF